MLTFFRHLRKRRADMTIGRRLILGFLVILAFLAAVGVFGVYQMNRLADVTAKMYRHPFTVSNAVRDVHINIVRMHRSMKDIVLSQDQAGLDTAVQAVEQGEQQAQAAFDIIRERFLGDQHDVEDLIQAFQQWKPIRDEVITLRQAGQRAAAEEIALERAQEHVKRLEAELYDLTDFAGHKAAQLMSEARSTADQALGWMLGLSIVSVGVGLALAVRISHRITRPLQQAAQIARQVSEGNLAVQFTVTSQDELGQMLAAMQQMIAYIQDAAAVTDQISRQHLDVTVVPKSHRDTLNQALQRMLVNLRAMLADTQRSLSETAQQNWLKDGLNQLNASVLGDLSLRDMGRIAVSFVARYVNAGHAVLYAYNADEQILRLSGAFAMTEYDQAADTYRLGEGLIGQVARDRAPIFLNNLRRADQVITTGTVSAAPLNTYTLPLIYNDDLYGVLEVATFEPLDAAQQRFLDEAGPVLATILFSTLQRERVQNLLEQSQQAAQEAELAVQEAQSAKAEAQQQSIELQRANTRLEEQQQQLQQQSEELRQINAHLEAQQHAIQEQRDQVQERELRVQQAQSELERRTRDLETARSGFDGRESSAGDDREREGTTSADPGRPQPVPNANASRATQNSASAEKVSVSDEIPIRPIDDDRLKIGPGDISILVIEGNADIAQSLADTIRGMGFRALIALSGYDGLALATRFHPTGIVLDLVLPDLNGMDVLRELKRARELRGIPVHIISGKNRDEAALKAGAVGFARKPVSAENVREIVQRLLQESQNTIRQVLIVEDHDAQREAIQQLLSEHAAVEVVGVASEAAALREIESGCYDAAIIDLGLKDGSGYDICRYVQERAIDLPLIIYTGKDLAEDEERELRQYTDSIIIKTAHSYERLQDEVLALLQQAAPGEAAAPIVAPAQSATGINFQGKKILVVDDDVKNVFVLASVLEEHGAAILDARNGREALDKLRAEDGVELVLMDVMMPLMDGYETMRAIRQDPRWKELPIIAITAKILFEDRLQCIEAGADDYLTKPVDYDSLLRLVSAWIEKD